MDNVYYPNGNYAPNNIYPPAISNTPIEYGEASLFLESILKNNWGKVAHLHMVFPESNDWRDKIFTGVIENTGRDFIIISDPATGKWYLLPLVFLSFIEFEEKITSNK